MIKKFIPCVIVLCFLLLLTCSCNNSGGQSEETTALKTVKDSKGNTFSAILGGDGFLLLGDRDELAITVDDGKGKPGRNSDGEFVTRVEPFPDTLTVGKEIHTKFVRMEIPENWKNESDALIDFSYQKGESTATFTVNERSSLTVKECQAEIEDLLSAIGEAKKEKVKFQFADAVKLNYENRLVVYVFNAEGRTYFVKITADEKLFNEINFEEIINTMKFRKGE